MSVDYTNPDLQSQADKARLDMEVQAQKELACQHAQAGIYLNHDGFAACRECGKVWEPVKGTPWVEMVAQAWRNKG